MNDGTSKPQIKDCNLKGQQELGREWGQTKQASLAEKWVNNGSGIY